MNRCPNCGRKPKVLDRPIPDSEFWIYLAQIESQMERLEKTLDQNPENTEKLCYWFSAIKARCKEALLMLSTEEKN